MGDANHSGSDVHTEACTPLPPASLTLRSFSETVQEGLSTWLIHARSTGQLQRFSLYLSDALMRAWDGLTQTEKDHLLTETVWLRSQLTQTAFNSQSARIHQSVSSPGVSSQSFADRNYSVQLLREVLSALATGGDLRLSRSLEGTLLAFTWNVKPPRDAEIL